MNDFQTVMLYAWNLMCTPFTLYGYTISYGFLYAYMLLLSLVLWALFKYFWR